MNQQDQPSSNTSEEKKKNFDSDKEEISQKNKTKTDDYTLSAIEELKFSISIKIRKK